MVKGYAKPPDRNPPLAVKEVPLSDYLVGFFFLKEACDSLSLLFLLLYKEYPYQKIGNRLNRSNKNITALIVL